MVKGIRRPSVVEIDEVDLIRGVLGLHGQASTFGRDCRCGRIFEDEAAVREHVAKQIHKTLREEAP